MDFFYSELNENFKGYKYDMHQHAPEINQEISKVVTSKVNIVFCPHLMPLNRGIFETVYIRLKRSVDISKIEKIYKRFYKLEPFIRIKDVGFLPQIKDVAETNFCDIGLVLGRQERLLVVASCIDNLLKGASGQAVQNMNIMCGFAENEALL